VRAASPCACSPAGVLQENRAEQQAVHVRGEPGVQDRQDAAQEVSVLPLPEVPERGHAAGR